VDLRHLLSPPQYEAATCLEVPVCILAGAGSGKTRVITHRIAWLMTTQRVPAESILAVTFTNKAAGEMRHRVENLVPGRGGRVQLGTFHGTAARLLRRYGRVVDLDPGFVIYDADDAERLLQRVITGDLNASKDLTGAVARKIDTWQSAGLLPVDVPKEHDLVFDTAIKAYDLYLEKLKSARAVDFGGLLVKLRQLSCGPDADVLRKRIRHILVDEYQDVNQVQADIVLGLGRGADSCAVVGDDDQAIYGWRGASADNLKKFMRDLPTARLVKLEENYRSTPAILEAANGIISENEGRLGKTLIAARTDSGRGRAVRVMKARDDIEEARRVVMLLIEHITAGVSLDEVAILYRANGSSRMFEDELRRHALPYRIIGGVRFYDRKEVKDVLATLRIALNRRSDVDGLRFLSAVPRGVGATTIGKIEAEARSSQRAVFEVMRDGPALIRAGLNAGAVKKALGVVEQLDTLADAIGRPARPDPQPGLFVAAAPLGAKDAIALAIKTSGVDDRLEAEGGVEAEGRLENLAELVNAAAAFEAEATKNGEVADIEAFLENAALLGSADEAAKDDGRGQITLMTLHAAKGLEFDVVFLVGLEEHGFPHSRAVFGDDPSAIEEERRLAYVGITRARQRLVISWAMQRMVQGVVKARDPSRFLFEIPTTALEGDVPRRSHAPQRGRDSLMELWHKQRQQRQARDDDNEPGSARVVYDDDAFDDMPRKPKESRTRLVLTEPGAVPADADVNDAVEGTHDAPEPMGTTVVVDDAVRPARRFSMPALPRPAPASPAASSTVVLDEEPAAFVAGARVSHRLFGEGTVVGQRGSGRAANILVRFDAERAPRLIAARHLQG
jgi:DNA helicase-2/ATP-dependent DNA helicase PcrA